MDSFTDKTSKDFFGKEWLVKLDNSRPYLFKFLKSSDGCSILVTDTVNVWFEALELKHIARRWRRLNCLQGPLGSDSKELEWRIKTLKTLESMHGLSTVQDALFSIEASRDADLAFELRSSSFKWRWECCSLGPKTSADILSKHLIMPLLSIAHLTFTCADAVSEFSTNDLEDAVDKLARTGRRSQDIHVRQTLSRPRVATTLARLTALFNFADSVPSIVSDIAETSHTVGSEDDDIEMKTELSQERVVFTSLPPDNAKTLAPEKLVSALDAVKSDEATVKERGNSIKAYELSKVATSSSAPAPEEASGSETEPDSEVEAPQPFDGKAKPTDKKLSFTSGTSVPVQTDSDTDRSIPRPPPLKKIKHSKVDSDSSDSGGTASKPSSGPRSKPVVRNVGVRQPVKRGGRRF